ncbi:MAG: benzoate 1,2-dioxygenase small subunit [Herminiimonas sp.]|nr:benzoate 1,2-dioxygenase small subunit [Herminiimonas sp.]
MITDPKLYTEVCSLLASEALFLDEQRFREWLDLYAEDAVYYVPAWQSEDKLTDDPKTQLSLIYIPSRNGLEERIFRIESRDSFASLPLDRTTHLTTNVLLTGGDSEQVEVSANWLVHSVGPRGDATRGGRYRYTLRRIDGVLRIARKVTIMIDEKLEGTVDVYHL